MLITAVGPGCEHSATGPWVEPVSTVTSLVLVAVGLAIAVAHRSRPRAVLFGLLVAAVGAGSVIQHGPAPTWSDLAHDLPLMGLLAFAAADAVADLTGRAMRTWWWLAPTLLLVPVLIVAEGVADAVQVVTAVVAIGASLRRAVIRPQWRGRLVAAFVVLAVGGLVGTLSRTGGPWCDPDSLLQGHGVWHLLVGLAMWLHAPVVAAADARRGGVDPGVDR